MKLLLEISDNKVPFLLEVLNNFSFVKKVIPINKDKEEKFSLVQELQNSFEQVKLIKEGKLSKQSTKEFLDEL
ncbi:MAG: hypothetical protein H6604_00255 [Flavobacteriales bacterium]|nr:hypothetical protein [Flavobacteriales bacterium]